MGRTLTDYTAVVTGASSGIGRATALALAAEGCNVALAARTLSALEAVAGEIRSLGREALVVPTDVTRPEEVERLVKTTLERWGRVDIAVAAAGIYVRRPVVELTVADVERSMATNFYGVLHLVLAVLPPMRQQRRGHLVLISSVDGKKGVPPDTPYVVAKFAVVGLGEMLRQELREWGIHVCTVCPGRVDTPMIAHIEVPRISAKIPPQRVARAIVRAIRRRQPEVIIPIQAKLLVYLNALFPQVGDWSVRFFHLEGREVSPPG